MLCERLNAWWLTQTTINNFAALFDCTPAVGLQTLGRIRRKTFQLSWFGLGALFCLLSGQPRYNSCSFRAGLVVE